MTAHTEREGLRVQVADLQRQIVRLRAEHMAARDTALEEAENEMRRRAREWELAGGGWDAGEWHDAALVIAEMREGEVVTNLREAVARALYEHREGPVANADFSRQQALWHDCLLQADAALAAIDAAGFAVVPREPTEEMLDTIAAQFSEYADSLPPRTIARRAWAGALIAAKP